MHPVLFYYIIAYFAQKFKRSLEFIWFEENFFGEESCGTQEIDTIVRCEKILQKQAASFCAILSKKLPNHLISNQKYDIIFIQ